MITKAAIYATFGVRVYWFADPDRETILVQTARDGVFFTVETADGIVRSLVLPGFEVDPVDVFTLPDWAQHVGM
jgi:Uma2 family endonuclease